VRLTTDLSRKNPFYSVLPESPLLAAIDVMRTGVHRVNVLGGTDGLVTGVLTQTDILRHLVSDSQLLLALNKVRVCDLAKLVHRPAISIGEQRSVLEAFKLMSESGVSSVAVVDAGRRLVGNISISDVRFLFKHVSMRALWKTCVDFISSNLYEEGLERGKVGAFRLSLASYNFFRTAFHFSMSVKIALWHMSLASCWRRRRIASGSWTLTAN